MVVEDIAQDCRFPGFGETGAGSDYEEQLRGSRCVGRVSAVPTYAGTSRQPPPRRDSRREDGVTSLVSDIRAFGGL